MVSLMLTAAFAAQAQLKVAPKMEKGTVKTYATETVVNTAGQPEFKLTCEESYTVTDATADGYVVDYMTKSVGTDASADNIGAQLMLGSQELLKGLNVRIATNKDGKPEKVVNYDELKGQLDKAADKLVDDMLKKIPQLAQMMPKESLKESVLENISEQSLLSAANIMELNGKTVMTGAQEDYTNEQGMKMKRMYFVNGKSIVTNGSLNMSRDEMKALIIAQVEKAAPDQAEMIKQNIDQVMDSGMVKMDMKETSTYELQDDGWVKSLKQEKTIGGMGQDATFKSTVTLK